MARYNSTTITVDKRRRFRVYKPTMYPSIPMKDSDTFIAPVVGEKLENLANRFYGDGTLWWIIAKANNINDSTVLGKCFPI